MHGTNSNAHTDVMYPEKGTQTYKYTQQGGRHIYNKTNRYKPEDTDCSSPSYSKIHK